MSEYDPEVVRQECELEIDRFVHKLDAIGEAIDAVLAAADARDQPQTSVNIPRALIERLREVSR